MRIAITRTIDLLEDWPAGRYYPLPFSRASACYPADFGMPVPRVKATAIASTAMKTPAVASARY